MIESIEIKNVASFDRNGIHLKDLKKVNFIYGVNGSGKTTISNLIAERSNSDFRHCEVNWKHNQTLKTLVYNRFFRDHNFGGSNKLKGVFTLGQATKEEIENIETKKGDLSVLKEDISRNKITLEKQNVDQISIEEDFKEFCWKTFYKKYENEFKTAFAGSLTKDRFKSKFIEENRKNNSELLSLDVLKEKAKTIFGEQPQHIEKIQLINFDYVISIENKEIWSKNIIGKSDIDIARLIEKLNNNDWVNQGRTFIQDNDICPFCQQNTINANFKGQLEEYFDESFKNDINELKVNQNQYEISVSSQIKVLQEIEANKNPKLNIESFSNCLEIINGKFSLNKGVINNKIKEPSRVVKIESIRTDFEKINSIIDNANKEIEKNNIIVSNFYKEKSDLIQAIWRFIKEEAKVSYASYLRKITGVEEGITNITKQLKIKQNSFNKLNSEIIELSKNITSIEPTINEINRMLKSYGFNNFEIVETTEKGFYQIQREDGSIAKTTLSEGEKTFITFLYYYQLTKGSIEKDEISEDRVLVIDDPISSLDSNILFIVSALIKDIINQIKLGNGNIKQLILLTHNVYFHKEVSFINGRIKECNETKFWILRKVNKITTLQSYDIKNPIQSSYELLWKELKEKDHNSNTTIQNTMRRIIENYFKILGKLKDDDLIMKFTSKEEQEICRSLLSWINDGSHCISDDVFIESQYATIDNYMNIFKQIFEKTDNIGHYNMMMEINN